MTDHTWELDPVEALARVLNHNRLGPETKEALTWLLMGESYRGAARRVGRHDWKTLHVRAKRLGLLPFIAEQRLERQERAQMRKLAALESRLMAGLMSPRVILELARESPY